MKNGHVMRIIINEIPGKGTAVPNVRNRVMETIPVKSPVVPVVPVNLVVVFVMTGETIQNPTGRSHPGSALLTGTGRGTIQREWRAARVDRNVVRVNLTFDLGDARRRQGIGLADRTGRSIVGANPVIDRTSVRITRKAGHINARSTRAVNPVAGPVVVREVSREVSRAARPRVDPGARPWVGLGASPVAVRVASHSNQAVLFPLKVPSV